MKTAYQIRPIRVAVIKEFLLDFFVRYSSYDPCSKDRSFRHIIQAYTVRHFLAKKNITIFLMIVVAPSLEIWRSKHTLFLFIT